MSCISKRPFTPNSRGKDNSEIHVRHNGTAASVMKLVVSLANSELISTASDLYSTSPGDFLLYAAAPTRTKIAGSRL